MKLIVQIIILVLFFKTGNVLSDNKLFNVDNILIEKKENIANDKLANQAIKIGFDRLINKILLNEDGEKVSDIDFLNIRQLVKYYNISKNTETENDYVEYSVAFDKDKIHDLFYKKGISYADISEKEFFVLPILVKDSEIFIFSNNYFYKNWNKISQDELIEFILPIENIEIIQSINRNRDNLFDIELNKIFKEYPEKNIALVFFEEKNNHFKETVFFKARIQNKNISKGLNLKKQNFNQNEFYDSTIIKIKNEIINLVKSKNLIDIRTPSFLNVKLNLDKKNNLVLLDLKLKDIELIENIFIQEFNKDYVKLKIKYLGKLEGIINQLESLNIKINLEKDEWIIKIL